MRQLLKASKFFSMSKNIEDIVGNYTQVSGCDRVQQIAKQAYLSATDYHKLLSGEHYSRLTDLVSFAATKKMHQKMSKHPTGQRILKQKPRITDEIFNGLSRLRQGTFGKQYYNFMSKLNFKPSERPIVKYIADLQYAYTLQRYKQIHDFLHVLIAKQISVDEELILKWFQMRQLQLPSATLASLISPLLSQKFSLADIANVVRIADRSEFVMNIYFEEHFAEPADEVRRKFRFQ